MRQIIFVSLMLIAIQVSAARQLTTFTIQYADPQQLQTVVQVYLSSESSVNVYRHQLVVNATETELAKIRELIARLDVGGRQLLISIKTGAISAGREQHIGASGDVVFGRGIETETRANIVVKDYRSSRSTGGGRGVRVTEGESAYISTGSTAPINQYRTTANGRYLSGQQYVSADSGFYATAWVNDNAVRVTISQQQQQFAGQTIENQQLHTEVTGQLGVWIPIGVITETRQSTSKGVLLHNENRGSRNEAVYLKVELLK